MTETRWVLIDPHDTMFFRDGRHFNQDDEGAVHAVSMFPPSPRTVAYMLRAALAAKKGWKDGENWAELDGDFASVLGDGSDDLGCLRFLPPKLLIEEGAALVPLYPAPLALVTSHDAKSDQEIVRRLAPGKPLKCDLGDCVRLPVIVGEKDQDLGGWKGVDSRFIKHAGLQEFLSGRAPSASHFVSMRELTAEERRVGLARVNDTRQAALGMLYTAVHRRMRNEEHRKVMLCAGFTGAKDWPVADYRPFGGEHRFAWLKHHNKSDEFNLPGISLPASAGAVRYTVTAISPLRLNGDGWRTLGGKLSDLPGAIVSACIGKAQMYGGWSSISSRSSKSSQFGPQALRPYIPAGSVWFMETSPEEAANFNWNKLPDAIGFDTEFGFGGCVYGIWQDDPNLQGVQGGKS